MKRRQKNNNNNNINEYNELENFKFMFHMSSVINCIKDKRKDQITRKNAGRRMEKQENVMAATLK